MEQKIKRNVRRVVEELDAAYSEFSDRDYMNGDYADFASMAVGQFREALRNPELTREELQGMVRSGIREHKTQDGDAGWTKFVASHIAQSSNANAVIDA
ncbi:MAG: hypothetical protein ACRBCK_03025 [Alphaproteobacteria bacterium]